MTFYEVTHLGEQFDTKLIGYFSTRENAEKAVAERSKEPGFRDYPGQFLIVKRDLFSNGNEGSEELYEAYVYVHSLDLEYEYSYRIGFFSDPVSAGEAAEWVKNHSQGEIPSIETEYIVWKPALDLSYWDGGFERYEPQQPIR